MTSCFARETQSLARASRILVICALDNSIFLADFFLRAGSFYFCIPWLDGSQALVSVDRSPVSFRAWLSRRGGRGCRLRTAPQKMHVRLLLSCAFLFPLLFRFRVLFFTFFVCEILSS